MGLTMFTCATMIVERMITAFQFWIMTLATVILECSSHNSALNLSHNINKNPNRILKFEKVLIS